MKIAGASEYILKHLKAHCTTKFTAIKKIKDLAKSLKICIRIDHEDKSKDNPNKFRTEYIGIPKEECKYYETLTVDSIENRGCTDNGFDLITDRDYFELALITDDKSDMNHYIANPIENVSPYFEKHYDEIEEYAYKNNIPIKSLISSTPLDAIYFSIPSITSRVVLGLWKLAVPTETAVAPARMNSSASSAVAIPPIPIIGTLTALAT